MSTAATVDRFTASGPCPTCGVATNVPCLTESGWGIHSARIEGLTINQGCPDCGAAPDTWCDPPEQFCPARVQRAREARELL